ncbi:radical SAM/SPASM domain-containing protein [Dysgonomonas massiliensis]|uniref:radical SAM/SPASM domain-containing protein n=1 Tax=Dysgonomonas massiliensis TaxID=2040292 RepID=UPI000C770D63|nr:radical SAM protein [Dysgonomonas massiliensis]
MRYSKYNVIKKINNSTWIFNCLTNAFLKIDSSVLENLENEVDIRARLFKEGILTNDEHEEYRYKYLYYNSAFGNKRINLYIAPTMNCNFSCFYCFEEGNKKVGKMSKEVEDAIVTYLEANKDKDISIIWFGGEPLLSYKVILSICKKLHDKRIAFHSSMISNGSLLTKSKIDSIGELNLTHIQISLDGLAEVHDKRRFFQNNNPSFDIIVSNIDYFLKSTKIPLYIQVAVDKTNSSSYEELLNYFTERYPEYMESKRMGVGCNFVLNKTEFDLKSNCYTKDEIYMKNIENTFSNTTNDLRPFLPGIAPHCMFRNPKSFAIDPSGDMFKCIEHLGNPLYKVGNILHKNISLTKISQTTFEADPFLDQECTSCKVFPICGGGCPIDRIKKLKGEDIDYCSIYKTRLADMLPYLYKQHLQ